MPTFAQAFAQQTKIQRRPKNPMDKCTIVSVFPLDIEDIKHTVFPPIHKIEAAKDDDFSITVIESASCFREMEGGNFIELGIPSIEVARAFIQDNIGSMPEYSAGVSSPGVFFVYGGHSKESIVKHVAEDGRTFQQMLDAARNAQKEWYLRIIKTADKDWAQTNGNPRAISNMCRLAVEKTGIQNKPWMQDFSSMQKEACPACGQFINPGYPVCPNCKVIVNKEKAKALGLTFAS